MAKQKKQLIILCAAAVLVFALYFILRAGNAKRAEEEAGAHTGGDYSVTALSDAAIDALTVQNENGTMTFALRDGTWVNTADVSIPQVQSRIEAMVNKGKDLLGVDRIEGVTDFDQYGLADPQMRVTLAGEGKSATILIGDTNTAVNRVYVCVEGENTVYTTGTSVLTQFDVTPDELVEEPEEVLEETTAQ